MDQVSLAARTAARWWADQLRKGSRFDMGADSSQGEIAEIMGQIIQHDELAGMQPESIDSFEKELTEAIEKLLPQYGSLNIGVDYHPDGILADAVCVAELQLGMASLPWKTNMRVCPDSVTVSAGYAKPYQEVPFLAD